MDEKSGEKNSVSAKRDGGGVVLGRTRTQAD